MSNAYLAHTPTALAPAPLAHQQNYYGNYGLVNDLGRHYNRIPAPVDPWPSVNQGAVQVNNLNAHGYVHDVNPGYVHSTPAPSIIAPTLAPVAPVSSYVPPPVLQPPSIHYNNNVIPPRVHNVPLQHNNLNYGVHGLNSVHGTNGIHRLNGFHSLNNVHAINGIHGLNGVHGINNIHGLNGLNGVHGLNGLSGLHGINGVHGINGYASRYPQSPIYSHQNGYQTHENYAW